MFYSLYESRGKRPKMFVARNLPNDTQVWIVEIVEQDSKEWRGTHRKGRKPIGMVGYRLSNRTLFIGLVKNR